MKCFFAITLLFCQLLLPAQSDAERIKKFMDTLSMGGTYLIGKTIPAFELKSIQGNSYTNESFKNKITVINFWFEACPPCIAEMNSLEQLYNDFKQYSNFQFLSITYENTAAINKLAEEYKITYPVLSTTTDSCYYLNFKKGFPTTVIVDGNGLIVFFTIGGHTDTNLADLYFKTNIYPLLNSMLK